MCARCPVPVSRSVRPADHRMRTDPIARRIARFFTRASFLYSLTYSRNDFLLLELRRLPPIMGFVGSQRQGWLVTLLA